MSNNNSFDGDLVSRACDYAVLKHFSTNHRYDGQPYSVHLNLVYQYGCNYGYLLTDNKDLSYALSGCWVHDVIEDCRETYNDVKNVLGEEVAEIAYALTNEKGKTRKERANDKYYEGIRNNRLAHFVKICDRLANVSYSKNSGSSMFFAYKKENEDFKKHLFCESFKDMFDELDSLLQV